MTNLDLTLNLQRKHRAYLFAHELWVERTEGLLDRFDTTLKEYINLQEARIEFEIAKNYLNEKVGA